MKARHKRLAILAVALAGLTLVTVLVLKAFEGNLSYFFSPTEVVQGKAPAERVFRLGGLVENGSLKREEGSLRVHFVVSDGAEKITVAYDGILPDLFKEGQGVIAQGKLDGKGGFAAQEVLAKHDENYMPPEVAGALAEGHAKGVADMAAAANQAPATNPAPKTN
jgi:cytochrome c-type biogenesis protein CcmE